MVQKHILEILAFIRHFHAILYFRSSRIFARDSPEMRKLAVGVAARQPSSFFRGARLAHFQRNRRRFACGPQVSLASLRGEFENATKRRPKMNFDGRMAIETI